MYEAPEVAFAVLLYVFELNILSLQLDILSLQLELRIQYNY